MVTSVDLGKIAPLTPGFGADMSDPASQKYMQATQEAMDALKARMNPDFNFGKLAQALLTPTRGGSFGESLGNAAGAIGDEQERQQKEAVPIAQMRAQLAGQEFQMNQRAKAMQGLQAMTGGAPQVIAAADLPMIAKTLNLAEDDPKLVQLVGQPKAPFMTGTGQSVIGATAQPTFSKDEVNQALIASGGDPSAAMKMLFERQTKWNEPGTMQKDIAYATDPKTPEFARQLAIQKLTIDARRLGIDVEKFFAETGVRLGGVTTSGRPAPAADGAAPVTGGGGSSTSREAVQIPAIFGADINAAVTTNFRAGHYGVDFAVPSGTPMAAPLDSTVIAAGIDPRSGNYISFKSADGFTHTVSHLSEALVTTGDKVPMGTNFGLVGATGNATGPHAHWEIKNAEGKPVDPIKYFGISGGAPAATTTAATPAASGTTPMVASGFQYPDGTEIKIPQTWPQAKVSEYVAKRLDEFQQNVVAANAKTAETYKEELGSIAGIKPTILFKQNEDFATAQAILKDPKVAPVIGQMYKQGFAPGIMTLLQNGVRFGNFSASVPAYETWLTSQPPYVQEQLNKLDKVLSGAYLAAMAARPFGAAPSNFEDIKSQNAMATARDPARIISEFMAEQRIANNYLIDVRERFDNFNATKSSNIQPHGFFGSAGYKEAKELYKKDYKAYKILGAP
jgi:murein DD-endopeptidase MepM/ murein hydrolase activator NlpD